ncbi:ribonuclease [Mycobacterium sp. NS-7484]|uniref:PIN domain-containing protein n=1 Tax=unclassified Mycobacterium TaxID=2642494 RepID=UPI0008021DE6|nr:MULTISPECIES: PIN domain-containing protein [unclassified Mycobacterium]OBG89307.1 ribonuclease [Mycobacterium sp. E802]OMC00931.1 ribonuclease [Mycobacterium sp. NS-7484]
MTLWVLDKSAHIRLLNGVTPPAEIDLADLALCEIGELEWLYSARSAADYERQRTSVRGAFAVLPAPPDIFDRVRRLQRDLAHHHGMWHRTAIPDLFIAETALAHSAGVLHHDRDYTRIAGVRPELMVRDITSG